jgi:hypothetical protein
MYKLKHVPTGLYYQPHKHRGSNLSKRGKIYQTATHGLSAAFRNKAEKFTIYVEKDSVAHKSSKEVLEYIECKHSYNQMKTETNTSDWIIENI